MSDEFISLECEFQQPQISKSRSQNVWDWGSATIDNCTWKFLYLTDKKVHQIHFFNWKGQKIIAIIQ